MTRRRRRYREPGAFVGFGEPGAFVGEVEVAVEVEVRAGELIEATAAAARSLGAL